MEVGSISSLSSDNNNMSSTEEKQQKQQQREQGQTAVYRKDIERANAVKAWMENEVKLPQYVQTFISNGYETMEIVKEIQTTDDLKDIGIELKGHQKIILSKVHALKGEGSYEWHDEAGPDDQEHRDEFEIQGE
eukprot:CAMPEP_0197034174 /NCGR_PEP_ID=MMETSP1384-20130603/12359_1 /TAXON_ID=29189 /ORGANISM="Ammonia sp." /LENGTH=133 /DNA_ID=CAMNT_0042464065 /DNA_START=1 /DNA_END=399 /DNA_ORIENTATION=+